MDEAQHRDMHSSVEGVGGLMLGVFAKHWTPGKTKTRLAASIGEEAAAGVSKCFLEATLHRLANARFSVSERLVAYTPPTEANAFADLPVVREKGWNCVPQGEGGLGTRMANYFRSHARESDGAVLVGSDSPDMPLAEVASACAWLAADTPGRRLVLGPTHDGGYWLVGCRGQMPPIFEEMPWSQPNLMQVTLNRLREAGWSEGRDYRLLASWYDVDEAADLRRLRGGLRGDDPALNRLADELDGLLGSD